MFIVKVKFVSKMMVLDVGCGCDGRTLENFLSLDYEIVGIDLFEEKDVNILHPHFKYIKQDARDLSIFHDKEFDLAFSICMMEHICNRMDLTKIAREIQRVAKQYAIIANG
jgi:ubiquinone/menaquinone biosynthesis C-methylase UbiE